MGSKHGLRGDLVQGTLDVLILTAVRHKQMHGYGIAEFIESRSDDVLKVEEGALYPALHRLENKGWIRAEWGRSENNRRAKFYRLTRLGRQQLADEQAQWNAFAGAVQRILAAG